MASSSSSSSRGRPQRQNRRNRSSISVVNVDEYISESTSAMCIDLTVDVSGYDVIDLTSGQNISLIDSPVVVLSPTDDVGPMRRRRGSGRRGRHRSGYGRWVTSASSDRSRSQVHMLSADSDSDCLPEFSATTSLAGTANESSLRSPEGVKIACPVCLDDVKQIQRSRRQVVSTTCGHIFCDKCIKTAVSSQHACPTCRKRLHQRSIHPLFL